MLIYDEKIKEILNKYLSDLENHFKADVIFYYGEIHPNIIKYFRDFIEKLHDANNENKKNEEKKLVIILNTPGGSAETTEKLVEITRYHYQVVHFIVPDYALSAGTIFCMSGNKIYMDYSSSLGPIDPQIYNGKQFVPALGYLDKVEELIKKAKQAKLTEAEFLILQSMDLAFLSRCEQARQLTVTLLKKWLVEYQFQDWNNETAPNTGVTLQEKEKIATQMAEILGAHKKWHSHNRYIGIQTLQKELNLKVEDYTNIPELRKMIRSYNDLITQFIARNGLPFFLHSRNHF